MRVLVVGGGPVGLPRVSLGPAGVGKVLSYTSRVPLLLPHLPPPIFHPSPEKKCVGSSDFAFEKAASDT